MRRDFNYENLNPSNVQTFQTVKRSNLFNRFKAFFDATRSVVD